MNDENAPWIAGSDCIAASLHTLSRRPLWVGRPTCHRGEMERSKHLHLCLPDLGSKPNDTAAPVNVWFTHRPVGRTAQISEGARLAGSKAFRLFNARSCEATKLDRQTKTAYKKEPRWLCKQQDCCGYTPALRRCISRNCRGMYLGKSFSALKRMCGDPMMRSSAICSLALLSMVGVAAVTHGQPTFASTKAGARRRSGTSAHLA